MAEVEVGTVEDRRRHSLAMIASVNWSVVAVPPRSRVTIFPSLIVSSIAVRTRSLLLPMAVHIGLDIPIYYAFACAS